MKEAAQIFGRPFILPGGGVAMKLFYTCGCFLNLTTANASNTASATLNSNNRFEIERSFYNNNFTVIAATIYTESNC